MAAAEILTVAPPDKSTGIALKQTISVIFSKEMDEFTINSGTFFLEAPDSSLAANSQLGVIKAGEKDFLQSPGYKGILTGTYEFFRVDEYGNEVETLDTVGTGDKYRTKVVLTPTNALAPTTAYKVYLFSDETATDALLGGISERTVFDTQTIVNTGTGDAVFTGGYRGGESYSGLETYEIEITNAGEPGTAIAQWTRTTDNVTGVVTVSTQRTLITDGLFVEFDPGEYEVGDTWRVVVRSPQYMPGNFSWTFTSGSGNIQQVPTDSSSSTIGSTTTTGTTEFFQVTSITPENRATNLTPELIEEIVVEFSKNIDPATITQDTVKVISESVNGDPNNEATGNLAKTLEVSGNKLTIKFT